MQRILVPLDGSETAEKVLPWVIKEGLLHGSTVVLLRVIPPLRGLLMMPPRLREQTNEFANGIAHDYLVQVSERLRDEGLNVEIRLEHGVPAEKIADVATEIECDLIVIGSRGETGATRWRFGSVALKVLKSGTEMPVLVVRT
jgi:nucleotide-binding universal stress UspA family protein